MFDRLRRNKNQDKEMRKAIMSNVLVADASRPLPEERMTRELGINIHMIEDSHILDTLNQLIAITRESGYIDFDLYALRNLVTKLLRTSRLEKIDAFILLKKSKIILRNIKMNMSDSLVALGVLNYIDSIEILLWTAITDAVGGWKGKLLKVTPKVFEISMPEKKKGGLMP